MNGWQIFVEISGRPPVEIRPGESIVGRSRTCQVHIPETTVSRQHARIIASSLGEVTVEDLGSSNGTFVNGEKTEGRRKLADGDRVLVGDAEMRMRIVAPVAPTEATVRLTLPPLGQMASPGAPPPMPAAARPAPPEPELEAWDDTPPAPIELPLEPLPTPRPAPSPAPQPPPPAAAPSAPPAFAPPPRPAAPPPAFALPPAPLPPPPPARPPAPPASVLAPPPAAPRVAPPPPAAPPSRPTPPPMAAPPMAPPPRPVPPPMAAPPMAPPSRPLPSPALAAPPMAAPPVAPPRPAAPPAAPKRKDELGSVTVIDRIPIPEPPPAVLQAAKLERARPAGFWIRVLAALIDALPMLVIAGAAAMLTWFVSPTLGLLVNLLALPYWAYDFVVMPAQQATTFGKKTLGLLIVHPSVKAGQGLGWSVAIIRLLGQFVSGILLGVGYLIVGFTSQKQGLHDMIANTRVVRVR